ncbi:hypothetical protein Pmani_004945 [Petrolisthes manimaculis]|uniref:Reverse transcriptase domain-containing protein n=1 Tax=Petrolisthes manimaculis TaxID=1843537 RepID=A0AAE1QDQ9_9EUCA|nr:hypothetical protein Pmani_004945 [Petrolisthes manimaculis]
MIKRCEEFYTKLYSTRQCIQPQNTTNAHIKENRSPPIMPSEVRAAIKQLKRDKAPGEDNITADILQDGGEPIIKVLTKLFNGCLISGKVPSCWKNAVMIIIHKKSDTADIRNYQPISLLPVIYKVFSKVLLQRMLQTLDQHQPREQEKANEYKIPLCFAFIDYEKAFDSIEFTPMFTALENQRVEPAYTTIQSDLYNGTTATLRLHKDSNKIKLERGARQGDSISPKLFTACLQNAIINRIEWDGKGINIDGEHLLHLISADDIILMGQTSQEIQDMLTDFFNTSKEAGLNIHLGKTKVMQNNYVNKAAVTIDRKIIDEVDSYS